MTVDTRSLAKADVEQAKLELRGKIETLRSTLVIGFVATILTLAAVIVAAVKL